MNVFSALCRALTRALQFCIPLCLSLHLQSTESLLSLQREVLEPPAVQLHFHILCTSTGCPLQDDTTDTQGCEVTHDDDELCCSYAYLDSQEKT